jgi:type IV pilus assembly protein PilX
MTNHNKRPQPLPSNQQGIVLFVALIVLVIMSLAGISMMRQVGVGQMIAGNLAFKQSATSSADRGAETARAFISSPATLTTTLDATSLAANPGYFSSTAVAFDPATYNWDTANASVEDTANDGAGNRVQHVTHRLCPSPGIVESQLCTTLVTSSGGSKTGTTGYDLTLPQAVQPYFRVTTRVSGPRNTTSYTQVILY